MILLLAGVMMLATVNGRSLKQFAIGLAGGNCADGDDCFSLANTFSGASDIITRGDALAITSGEGAQQSGALTFAATDEAFGGGFAAATNDGGGTLVGSGTVITPVGITQAGGGVSIGDNARVISGGGVATPEGFGLGGGQAQATGQGIAGVINTQTVTDDSSSSTSSAAAAGTTASSTAGSVAVHNG